MKKGESLLALLITIFLAVLWLGFLFHHDERFAGSAAGGAFAIAGSVSLLLPLLYSIIKRVPKFKSFITKKISFPSLLTIHIYAGFVGTILVVIHTGHKFDGILGTVLTAFLLIVVFSGYTGRYLLSRSSKDVGEQKTLLAALENQYAKKVVELHSQPIGKDQETVVFKLAESIADVEYAISTHDLFRRIFSIWLKFHITLSLLFYLLLVLHIIGVYYFGLRWFR